MVQVGVTSRGTTGLLPLWQDTRLGLTAFWVVLPKVCNPNLIMGKSRPAEIEGLLQNNWPVLQEKCQGHEGKKKSRNCSRLETETHQAQAGTGATWSSKPCPSFLLLQQTGDSGELCSLRIGRPPVTAHILICDDHSVKR